MERMRPSYARARGPSRTRFHPSPRVNGSTCASSPASNGCTSTASAVRQRDDVQSRGPVHPRLARVSGSHATDRTTNRPQAPTPPPPTSWTGSHPRTPHEPARPAALQDAPRWGRPLSAGQGRGERLRRTTFERQPPDGLELHGRGGGGWVAALGYPSPGAGSGTAGPGVRLRLFGCLGQRACRVVHGFPKLSMRAPMGGNRETHHDPTLPQVRAFWPYTAERPRRWFCGGDRLSAGYSSSSSFPASMRPW